jgi:membrane associated rhomboid family serine protease
MLFPYRIDTLFKHAPHANWVLMALTVLCFGLQLGGGFSYEVIDAMVLDGWGPTGLIGHLFLHTGLMHLLGNMLFLWVFGNAVCGNTSNRVYPLLYLAFGLAAAGVHVVFDGDPAVGASGAINGVVGMALAMYPLNRVRVAWFFAIRAGTFELPLWGLALIWLFFDLWGAIRGASGVAYWAHLGGFFAGLGAGYWALRQGRVTLTRYDHRSLEEIVHGKSAEARRERILEEETKAEENADPQVLILTAHSLARWSATAREQVVSEEDAAIIEEGGPAGRRKNFELLYERAFRKLGFSFHRSLEAYYRGVAEESVRPHDREALASFLRMVEEDFAAMRACRFIDPRLAAGRNEERMAAFLQASSKV